MSTHLKAIHTHALDFWYARSSVVVIVGLQLLIINKLTLGPRWLAPVLECALLIPLSFVTAWTQGLARDASTENHWLSVAKRRRAIRGLALALTACAFAETGQILLTYGHITGCIAGADVVDKDLQVHLGLAAQSLDVGHEMTLVGSHGTAESIVILKGGSETERQYG